MSHENSGFIVKIATEKTGLVYRREIKKGEKIQVHVIDPDSYELTGEKLLCDPDKLKVIGMHD